MSNPAKSKREARTGAALTPLAVMLATMRWAHETAEAMPHPVGLNGKEAVDHAKAAGHFRKLALDAAKAAIIGASETDHIHMWPPGCWRACRGRGWCALGCGATSGSTPGTTSESERGLRRLRGSHSTERSRY